MAATIWKMKSTENRWSEVDGTQVAYNAAVVDLTASGGFIQISPGLEGTIVPGIPPANVIVMWLKTTGPAAWEIVNGNFIISNAQSYRIRDAAGTARTVVRVNGDFTDIAAVGNNGIRLIKNDGTVWDTITAARWNMVTGQDLAFNGDPGIAGVSIPISGGPGALPAWSSLPGITAGSTSYYWIPAQSFGYDQTGIERIFHRSGATDSGSLVTQLVDATDTQTYSTFVVPPRYASTSSWKLYLTSGGVSTNLAIVRFGLAKLTDGASAINVHTVTDNNWTAPGVADQLKILTVSTPALTLAAGDVVKVEVRRDTSGADINPDNLQLLGALLTFNT